MTKPVPSSPECKSAIAFDPANPFPLLASNALTYSEAQRHSAEADAFLGLRTEEIESRLGPQAQQHPDQQLWIGLPVRSLLTPYTELRRMLIDLSLPEGSRVVDLGAGYGRMAFVVGRHHPEISFLGYEFVAARVEEARRCLAPFGFSNVAIVTADLTSSEFQPQAAETYFLYDYGTRSAIEKTLQDLRAIAQNGSITVIGRGRASRDAIERDHPWLSQVHSPQHKGHYSIYRS